jgi:ubiquinone/menaquinone biosynthesis C-methylase UbiE
MNWLKQVLFKSKIWNSSFFGKNKRELNYWKGNIQKMCNWYDGVGDYYLPNPKDGEKVKEFNHQKNAILTYTNKLIDNGSYLKDLCLDKSHFSGKSIADIGSGPFPTLLVFEDCRNRYCIDHLNNLYKEIGYPHDHYSGNVEFVDGKSESIPLKSKSLDAVISVNALDHVDNFQATATEILRVLKDDGELHLAINCHKSVTSTETQAISKEMVLEAFSTIDGIEVISINNGAYGFEDGETILFSNRNKSKMSNVS